MTPNCPQAGQEKLGQRSSAAIAAPMVGVEPKSPPTGLASIPDFNHLLCIGDGLALSFSVLGFGWSLGGIAFCRWTAPAETRACCRASSADRLKLAFSRNAFVQFTCMFDVIFKFTVALR